VQGTLVQQRKSRQSSLATSHSDPEPAHAQLAVSVATTQKRLDTRIEYSLTQRSVAAHNGLRYEVQEQPATGAEAEHSPLRAAAGAPVGHDMRF